ncbi:MAG: winged helix-turn-helix transcriptional regulator [Alphaproteobacteria bacterium]|nr:winged helix-turn-helix transcriptional regulator [Alphaproteobacteria bacterium]
MAEIPPEHVNSQGSHITILAQEIMRNALEPLIEHEGLADFCCFEPHEENVIILRYNEQDTLFSLPVRMGKIIDKINFFYKKLQGQRIENLDFGHGILSVALGHFSYINADLDDGPIILTEKEVEILRYLHANAPRKISREELLDAVWEYAKNVETHTLETHIYRLRQKIEPDPASPVILKKDDDGYYLGSTVS